VKTQWHPRVETSAEKRAPYSEHVRVDEVVDNEEGASAYHVLAVDCQVSRRTLHERTTRPVVGVGLGYQKAAKGKQMSALQ
jgi:hypothetical protein